MTSHNDFTPPPIGEVLRQSRQALWQLGGFRLLISIGLGLLLAVVPVGQIWATARTVDSVAALARGTADSLRDAITFMALQGALGALSFLLNAEQRLIQSHLTNKVAFAFKQRALAKVSRLELSKLEHPECHNQLHRFETGGVDAPLSLFNSVVTSARTLVTLSGYLMILARSSLLSLVATFIAFGLSAIVENRLSQRDYGLQVRHSPLQRKLEYFWHLLLRPGPAKEIRTFGLTQYLQRQWAELFVQMRSEELEKSYRADRARGGIEWANTILLIGVSASLLFAVSGGRLTIGDYVALNIAVAGSQSLARELSGSLALNFRFFRMAGDLFAFFGLPEPTPKGGWQTLPDKFEHGISCSNLSYVYPGQAHPALSDINLHIRTGERVALVGSNGAGKSTLVKCLLGLYRPTTGSVTYDGIDLRGVRSTDLPGRVAAVFQDHVRYALSIRENIGFGRLDLLEDDKALLEAARAAHADFVQEFDVGLETTLDRTYHEEGTDLSLGQWQKLALARALLSKAEVLILDEPSSSLDPLAESEIFHSFDLATKGKTVLFISHRLGSVRMADRIIAMDGGRIVETGSHDELMAAGGLYANLYMAQAKWYQRVHLPEPAHRESVQI